MNKKILSYILLFVATFSVGIYFSGADLGKIELSSQRVPAEYASDPSQLSFQKMVDLVKAQHLSSVGATLSALRKNYPDYFSFYTLGYKSRSAQTSSYLAPRAIVFGPTGQFVFTFNGDPDQKKYNAIETMTYNRAHGDYDFQEIRFKKEDNHLVESDPAETLYEDDIMVVSQKDPMSCLMCHGFGYAHPIWENYFNWPGFYGSNDDNLFLYADNNGRKPRSPAFGREINSTHDASNELKNWIAFQQVRGGSRYGTLPNLNPKIIDAGDESYRPNLYLNQLIHRQTMHNLAMQFWQLKQGPALSLSLFTLIECDQNFTIINFNNSDAERVLLSNMLEQLFPPKLSALLNPFANSDHGASEYSQYLVQLTRMNMQNFKAMHSLEPFLQASDQRGTYPEMQTILNKEFGSELKSFFRVASDVMSGESALNLVYTRYGKLIGGFEVYAYNISGAPYFSEGGNGLATLANELQPLIEKMYPNIPEVSAFRGDANLAPLHPPQCSDLIKKTREVLDGENF